MAASNVRLPLAERSLDLQVFDHIPSLDRGRDLGTENFALTLVSYLRYLGLEPSPNLNGGKS